MPKKSLFLTFLLLKVCQVICLNSFMKCQQLSMCLPSGFISPSSCHVIIIALSSVSPSPFNLVPVGVLSEWVRNGSWASCVILSLFWCVFYMCVCVRVCQRPWQQGVDHMILMAQIHSWLRTLLMDQSSSESPGCHDFTSSNRTPIRGVYVFSTPDPRAVSNGGGPGAVCLAAWQMASWHISAMGVTCGA